MFTGSQIRQRYLDFFKTRGHVVVPSAPLEPENDPTTLFTGSGMQPMLQYLLGTPFPRGSRVVDSQKCFRSQDIEEVGDNRHDTFFEMLGNWSLGDYFKAEQIPWIFDFFTSTGSGVGLDPRRLYISVFRGNPDINIPRDQEAVDIWKQTFAQLGIDHQDVDFPEQKGMQGGRIFYYDAKKNWWSRAGVPENMPLGEPGGPSSEVFFDFGKQLHLHEGSKYKADPCHPNCDCGRFVEIGNNVFMAYVKTATEFVPLENKNIDFGGGLERIAAAIGDDPDMFKTDLFWPIIEAIVKYSGQNYDTEKNKQSVRIVADHMKAASFLIADGVLPSNKAQGYFLRRLLRRAMVKMQQLKGNTTAAVDDSFYSTVLDAVIGIYQDHYFTVSPKQEIIKVILDEKDRFGKTLQQGLKKLDASTPFDLYQTYGFPIEVVEELYIEKGLTLDKSAFESSKSQHQELSRTAGRGMFKGGLQDHSEITTKYHTATHLLHAALRKILGTHVSQQGSNITAERLRFDFSHPDKLTPEQISQVENLINQKISENIPVTKVEMAKSAALAQGALAFFPEKYPDITNVYSIGTFSKELCGGPHVSSTGEIGRIKIIREESAGSGIHRIYATALSQKIPQTN